MLTTFLKETTATASQSSLPNPNAFSIPLRKFELTGEESFDETLHQSFWCREKIEPKERMLGVLTMTVSYTWILTACLLALPFYAQPRGVKPV